MGEADPGHETDVADSDHADRRARTRCLHTSPWGAPAGGESTTGPSRRTPCERLDACRRRRCPTIGSATPASGTRPRCRYGDDHPTRPRLEMPPGGSYNPSMPAARRPLPRRHCARSARPCSWRPPSRRLTSRRGVGVPSASPRWRRSRRRARPDDRRARRPAQRRRRAPRPLLEHRRTEHGRLRRQRLPAQVVDTVTAAQAQGLKVIVTVYKTSAVGIRHRVLEASPPSRATRPTPTSPSTR